MTTEKKHQGKAAHQHTDLSNSILQQWDQVEVCGDCGMEFSSSSAFVCWVPSWPVNALHWPPLVLTPRSCSPDQQPDPLWCPTHQLMFMLQILTWFMLFVSSSYILLIKDRAYVGFPPSSLFCVVCGTHATRIHTRHVTHKNPSKKLYLDKWN